MTFRRPVREGRGEGLPQLRIDALDRGHFPLELCLELTVVVEFRPSVVHEREDPIGREHAGVVRHPARDGPSEAQIFQLPEDLGLTQMQFVQVGRMAPVCRMGRMGWLRRMRLGLPGRRLRVSPKAGCRASAGDGTRGARSRPCAL